MNAIAECKDFVEPLMNSPIVEVPKRVFDIAAEASTLGIGWLMEHLAPLNELLDYVTGDEGEIHQEVNRWRNVVAAHISTFESASVNHLARLRKSWKGEAADEFDRELTTVLEGTECLRDVGKALATQLQVLGSIIGALRSLVVDTIATLLARLAVEAAAAAASSWFTFGGSVATFAADATVAISLVTARISAWIAKTMRRVAQVAKNFALVDKILVKVVKRVEKAARRCEEIARWAAEAKALRHLAKGSTATFGRGAAAAFRKGSPFTDGFASVFMPTTFGTGTFVYKEGKHMAKTYIDSNSTDFESEEESRTT